MSNVFPQENGETRQPPLPCVEASELVLRATDRAFHDIRRLAHVLGGVNLDSRREDLLDYIRLNRGRFIKAYATISWLSGGHGELIANAGNALAESRFQREQIDTVSTPFGVGLVSIGCSWMAVIWCRAGNDYKDFTSTKCSITLVCKSTGFDDLFSSPAE